MSGVPSGERITEYYPGQRCSGFLFMGNMYFGFRDKQEDFLNFYEEFSPKLYLLTGRMSRKAQRPLFQEEKK